MVNRQTYGLVGGDVLPVLLGMIVVIRVLGLILCAMAVQFIMAGVAASTTGLVLPGVSSPYGS